VYYAGYAALSDNAKRYQLISGSCILYWVCYVLQISYLIMIMFRYLCIMLGMQHYLTKLKDICLFQDPVYCAGYAMLFRYLIMIMFRYLCIMLGMQHYLTMLKDI
jgi:hypothetical protein